MEEGNVWKVAAFNRKFDGQTVPGASSQLALSVDVSAGGSLHDGGGGGMQASLAISNGSMDNFQGFYRKFPDIKRGGTMFVLLTV